MNILITGIYGFLGSHLARKLVEAHDVVGLYNTNTLKPFPSRIRCFNSLDLIDIAPDVVIMCHAAVSSGTTQMEKDVLVETNVNFTKRVMKKYPQSKIIYISSVSVFGNAALLIHEKSLTSPQTDYAKSKLLAEKTVSENSNNIIIRFSSLYGNGMSETTLIPNYSHQALQFKCINVWGNGSRFQNYIHVDDAVSLIEKVLNYKTRIDFPILGVALKEYTNDEVAKLISNLTQSEINYVKQDDSISFRYDNSMTQNKFNWQPATKLELGLQHYLEWKKK